jgi:phosphatidylserine/phosphatidylglycerophosphate/cardiolipin synthase-like enzyme
MDRNRLAAEALGRMGIPVSYVEGPLLHAKVLIVDRRTIFVGSSNWTTAAFGENVETGSTWNATTHTPAVAGWLVPVSGVG